MSSSESSDSSIDEASEKSESSPRKRKLQACKRKAKKKKFEVRPKPAGSPSASSIDVELASGSGLCKPRDDGASTSSGTNSEEETGIGHVSNKRRLKRQIYKKKKAAKKKVSEVPVTPPPAPKPAKKKLLPEMDDEFEVHKLEGLPTVVRFLKNRKHIRRNRSGADRDFPPTYSSLKLPKQTAKQRRSRTFPKTYKWVILKKAKRRLLKILPPLKDSSAASMAQFKTDVAALLVDMEQGAVGNCWLLSALYWIVSCDEQYLFWLLPKAQSEDSADIVTVRLRVNNTTVQFELDRNVAVYSENSEKMAFASRVLHYLFVCYIEKGAGMLHGSIAQLTNGMAGEGMALFKNCATIQYDPEKMELVKICEVVQQGLDAKHCVAIGSKSRQIHEAKVNPYLPKVIYSHAFVVKKAYFGMYENVEPVVVYAVKDIHNKDYATSDLNPEGDLFHKLDETTRANIIKDTNAESGIVIITTDGLKRRFDTLEIIIALPPKTEPFVNGDYFNWKGMSVKMEEFSGSLNLLHKAGYNCAVGRAAAFNVAVFTQLGQRIGQDEDYFDLGLKVNEKYQKTEVSSTLQKRANFQVAVAFRSTKAAAYTLLPLVNAAEKPDAPFQLQFYSFKNYPKEEKLLPLYSKSVMSEMCRRDLAAKKAEREQQDLHATPASTSQQAGVFTCKDEHALIMSDAL